MKVERIKGFRDQYPEEMEPRKKMFSIAENTAELFGFGRIDFPSLEYLDLYRIKSGDELLNQTFSFTDRGGREVTMLPEATPSTVRLLTSRKDIPRPVRWYSLPKIWRYEEPQSGRLREHFQFNADIFGVDTPEADAEIINLAGSILTNLGLGSAFSIHINDRVVMDGILKYLGVENTERVFTIIDRFHKTTRDEFLLLLRENGVSEKSASILLKLVESPFEIGELGGKISDIVGKSETLSERLDRLTKTCDIIRKYGKANIMVDFSVIRGISYYTGIVFEAFDRQGEFRSILGGGRYDNLASLMSGQEIPAVGFGMGDVVLELLMRREGKWGYNRKDYTYVLCFMGETLQYALEVADKIRKNGVICVMDLSPRGLSKQIRSAESQGFRYILIIGEKEKERGTVTVRDLKESSQSEKTLDSFISDAKKTVKSDI
ncbi:histidine--tRNA ligase [Oxyplasma meridianum]|uniref:Histidine--tRNA ligase n=1 Tax=Oxyplasma meridianum TaxID=3073602 RepID=A0AAX4NHB5_9ARCH